MKPIKKAFFKTLAKVNRLIMPRYSKKDITKLTKFEKAMVGYRYYITKNALD